MAVNKQKNILLLHSSSDLYGASKIFLQTVCLLKDNGHNCIVVLSQEGPLASALRELGIAIQIINLGIIRRKYFNISGIINRYNKWVDANRLLKSIVEKEKIDIVYSNTAAVLVGGWVVAAINKTGKRVKHYWHIHEIIQKPIILYKLIAWLMRTKADKIIVVSKAVMNHWVGKGDKVNSTMQDKTTLIYNGIEPLTMSQNKSYKEKFAIQSDAIVIGMAGRIHYWKGQEYFLNIAKSILNNKEATMQIYFILAGDAFPGYEYLVENINDFIKENNLRENIFYIGFEQDMDCFYRSVDILVLPSQLPDPLPTVVLEAMQYGIPVVATPQGGALEMVVNNETGIFIPMQDANKAANKIVSILNKDIIKTMGESAKQRVHSRFTQSVFEQKIIDIFETV